MFRPESVNDTMTDVVGFDLRLSASQAGRPPAVLGIEETRDASPGTVLGPRISTRGGDAPGVLGRAVALPVTGATLPLWVLLLDLAAVLAGATMVVGGRRVARHQTAVPRGI